MPKPQPAAVLVPLYRDDSECLRVVLIRRTGRGIHGGQIAFPGGRPEAGDASALATALRETHEEIGLAPERVTVIEHLPMVQTRSSQFEIQPFLGRIAPTGPWRPGIDEVEAVLTPSVEALADPRAHRPARVRPPGWHESLDVAALQPDADTVIWGATYRILLPLLGPLLEGHWDV